MNGSDVVAICGVLLWVVIFFWIGIVMIEEDL